MGKISGYITIKEAANRLGISVSAVHSYTKLGRIEAIRFGGIYLVDEADVERKKGDFTPKYRREGLANPYRFTAYVEREQFERVKETAKAMKISVSELASIALDKYIEEVKKNG